MVKLAVIADDLTGANDTAVQFAKRNISACVRINFDEMKLLQEKSDVVVVDTDSRDDSAADAYTKVQRVSAVFKSSGIRHVYKKVDSTLRGNLGAEIAAAADVFLPDLVVIAPAFPSNRRTTIGGYHFLDGVPIELTEIAHAPKTPVNESQIVKLLHEQTDSKIAEIPLAIIREGAAAIAKTIGHCLEREEKWVVFDVAAEEHFDAIIEAVQSYEKILWVGSAGLADHLPGYCQWSPYRRPMESGAAGGVCIIAGSVSRITQEQIREVLTKSAIRLVKLDAAKLFLAEMEELQRCVREINQHLAGGQDVLLVSAVDAADVAAAVMEGRRQGLADKEVSERTAAALAKIAAGIDTAALAGLVLTGGDTAVHVCRALQAESIEVLDEVTVGIPLGKLSGGCCDGLRVVTKAGAFGDKTSFLQAVSAIRQPGEFEERYRRMI